MSVSYMDAVLKLIAEVSVSCILCCKFKNVISMYVIFADPNVAPFFN